jgi:hypothetical protein
MATEPGEKRALTLESGVGLRTIDYLLDGRSASKRTRALLSPVIVLRAANAFRRAAPWERHPINPRGLLVKFLELPPSERRCEECGDLLPPQHTRWCKDGCRNRPARRRAKFERDYSEQLARALPTAERGKT